MTTSDAEQQPGVKDNSKKYKIALGVLAAVTVIAVVGGFVAAFQINSSSVEKIIKNERVTIKDKEGKATEEDIEIDETDNIAKFRVTTGDKKSIYVIQDYGRKLAIMEDPTAEEPTCVVSVLNTSNSVRDLEQMKGERNDEGAKRINIVQQPTPIANTDFLSAEAQEMCKGHLIYWATEQCGDALEVMEETGELEAPDREKRHWVCSPYCWYCYYVYYPYHDLFHYCYHYYCHGHCHCGC